MASTDVRGDLVALQSVQVHPPLRPEPRMLAAGGPRERSDEELARLGSAGAEALFHRHHAALYRFCLGFLSHGDEAADVMQTVWERAFVTFSKRDGAVLKVRPWLYAVARNECLDVVRGRGAHQTVDMSEVELSGGVVPEERVEQRAELQLLLDDLAELSERQRSALVLRELAGLDAQELASTLETSPARALGLVAEARRSLVARRGGRGMPCAAAQRELGHMRRRSSAVQSHLDCCSHCRTFERRRRGRSLSSLAFSPPLFVQDLVAQLSALFPAAPHVIAKTTVATAVVAGAVGFGGPVVDRFGARDDAPQAADVR
ncbi:MAG TPA: sigma-70 family RNA polymerase sigma factor, partial [Solirubrobacteraceae bacterium]|nr:sigma-70 family RNA polymerase sigma factor [Solirubrobacteraceae bacterium]